MAILGAFGFFKGLAIGPLVNIMLHVDPSVVITALLGTVTVFTCFSLSALTAKRASYLYLGGVLGSALTLLFYIGIANMFFRSIYMYNLQLYGGLLMFSGFVVFDTQVVIEVTKVFYLSLNVFTFYFLLSGHVE